MKILSTLFMCACALLQTPSALAENDIYAKNDRLVLNLNILTENLARVTADRSNEERTLFSLIGYQFFAVGQGLKEGGDFNTLYKAVKENVMKMIDDPDTPSEKVAAPIRTVMHGVQAVLAKAIQLVQTHCPPNVTNEVCEEEVKKAVEEEKNVCANYENNVAFYAASIEESERQNVFIANIVEASQGGKDKAKEFIDSAETTYEINIIDYAQWLGSMNDKPLCIHYVNVDNGGGNDGGSDGGNDVD